MLIISCLLDFGVVWDLHMWLKEFSYERDKNSFLIIIAD